jgi:hypothetical protein
MWRKPRGLGHCSEWSRAQPIEHHRLPFKRIGLPHQPLSRDVFPIGDLHDEDFAHRAIHPEAREERSEDARGRGLLEAHQDEVAAVQRALEKDLVGVRQGRAVGDELMIVHRILGNLFACPPFDRRAFRKFERARFDAEERLLTGRHLRDAHDQIASMRRDAEQQPTTAH